MTKLVVTAMARQDLFEINSYISAILLNPTAAKQMIKGITAKLRTLEQFPAIGKMVELEESSITYRYLLCGSYIAFYHIENDLVLVDRILYSRRNYLKLLLGNQEEDEVD